MTVTVWSALLGWVRLALVLGPLCLAATALQKRAAPHWHGATAVLARAVIALATAVVVAEAIGTVGWFSPWIIVMAEAGVALAVLAVLALGAPAAPTDPVPAGAVPDGAVPDGAVGWPLLDRIAMALVVATVLLWVAMTWWLGRQGVIDNDSLRYHGPFVARWLQTHSLTELHYTSSELQEVFFPANSEALTAIGVGALGTDWLLPVLNLAWMALALLAGWTLGDGRTRRFTLVAVTAVLAAPLLVRTQPASARNDVAAAALLLAAAALALRADRRFGAVAVAGAATGLAVGSKLSVLFPAVVLSVAVVVLAGRGRRVRTAGAFAVPAVATGGFWFVRNWVRVGNPLPWYRLRAGPVELPALDFPIVRLQGRTIADYAGSTDFWLRTVPGGLTDAVGALWPVFVAVAVAGVVAAAVRRGQPRVLAAMAAVGVAADVVTPYSAGGTHGPTMFPTQLRFLILAAMLGLVCFAIALRPRSYAILTALCGAVLAQSLWSSALPFWVVGAIVVIGVVVVIALADVAVRRRLRERPVGFAALGVVAAGCVAFSVANAGLRYQRADPRGKWAAYAYFDDVHDARVAVGVLGHTYPLTGPDLSNHVQRIGIVGADGSFRPARTCEEWQGRLIAGRYDYAVVGRAHSTTGREPPEAGWTERLPGAERVLRSGTTSVYRLSRPGPVDCPPGGTGGSGR
jgi:hypothetical protein